MMTAFNERNNKQAIREIQVHETYTGGKLRGVSRVEGRLALVYPASTGLGLTSEDRTSHKENGFTP
jgi:hypothetical protein